MTEIHELRDLEHLLGGEPPPEREADTLSDYHQDQINDGLFSTKALSEMNEKTQQGLCAQGIGPYQRCYMRRWAQFVMNRQARA